MRNARGLPVPPHLRVKVMFDLKVKKWMENRQGRGWTPSQKGRTTKAREGSGRKGERRNHFATYGCHQESRSRMGSRIEGKRGACCGSHKKAVKVAAETKRLKMADEQRSRRGQSGAVAK